LRFRRGGSLDHPTPLVERHSLWQSYTLLRISTEGDDVPKLEVEDVGTFDVPENKRLVLAIEEDAGVDILHRCGSYARCTTCRIEYLEGEPEKMTRAEVDVLESRDLLGQVRLSCQALCDHDMKVRVLMTVSSSGLDGPGPHPESHITPEPEWVDKPA
jgi:ferredoxin